MPTLILGLAVFFGMHSVRIVASGFRDAQLAASEGRWKGIYSVVSVIGLVLIIWGWHVYRPDAPEIYEPPTWGRHLTALLVLVAFILLANGEIVGPAGKFFAERRHRQLWRRVVYDLHEALGHYVRALLLLSLATLVAWTIVLSIARVPYALILATVAALLEFVPLVGPLVAAVIAVVVSMMTGYAHPVLVAGFAIAWRLVQDYVTSPLVMGRGIELPPGLVILAILAGGELAGPVGMFLAVPVLATLRIIRRDSREEAHAAPTAVRRAG